MCGVARPKLRFLHVHARLERALTSAISCERYFHVFMKLAMMDENLKIQYAYDYVSYELNHQYYSMNPSLDYYDTDSHTTASDMIG